MDTREDLIALLDWYRDLGVDAVVGEAPVNWLERPSAPPGADMSLLPSLASSPTPIVQPPEVHTPSTVPRSAPALPSAAAGASPAEARGRAPLDLHAITNLDGLRRVIAEFDGCALKATAKNLCFYRGAPDARVMIIGEAPGRDEDLEGRPFVGRAGQLLDKMLSAIGLSEADVHITNIVYWRPPGNRTPTAQEALACRPFLTRQMELVSPDVVITLGGPAAKELFGTLDGIMRLRGKWRHIDIGTRKVAAMAMLHPAYLLRTPAAKNLAWRDLLELQARLAGPLSES